MASVMIVESDPTVRRLLVERFTRDEYRVVADLERFAGADLVRFDPDLLVLEVMGGGDLEPLPLLRRRSSVPTSGGARIVEERIRRTERDRRVDGDDIVEVFEEASEDGIPPRRKQRSRRNSGGYRH